MQTNKWFNERTLLMLMSIIMPLTFSTWHVLLNNFAIEQAAYNGAHQSSSQSTEISGEKFLENWNSVQPSIELNNIVSIRLSAYCRIFLMSDLR